MKAFLIDPENFSISEVEYSGDYRDIYKLTGCDTFDVVRLDEGDGIFVDDEGLLKSPRHFFRFGEECQWLAGKGLVLGSNDEGESIAPKITLEELRRHVFYRTVGGPFALVLAPPRSI